MNPLVKYADDINLFIPSDSDVTDKYNNVIKWAAENGRVMEAQKVHKMLHANYT